VLLEFPSTYRCTRTQNEKGHSFLAKCILGMQEKKVLKILVIGIGPLENKKNLQFFGTGVPRTHNYQN